MQYLLRFVLSSAVIMSHLWADAFGSSGSYSVTGFYVVSGYVITKVLNERYWRIDNGFKKFWLNRFLRLYPTYVASALIGLMAASIFPEAAAALGIGLVLPASDAGRAWLAQSGFDPALTPLIWLVNVTIVGVQSPFIWTAPIAFSPNAWSISVELFFYLVLSLGAARSYAQGKFRATAVGFVGVLFSVIGLRAVGALTYPDLAPVMRVNDWMLFYKTFLGWTFFFAAGSAAYFVDKALWPAWVRPVAFAAALAGPFVYANTVHVMIALRFVYGGVVAFALAVNRDDIRSPLARFLGDLSYPMFLTHWPAAALVGGMFGIAKNSPEALATTFALTIAISSALVLLIERPIERLRAKYRV